MRILSVATLFILTTFLGGHAQEAWVAPVEAATRLSPKIFTDSDVSEGEKIYQTNCLSCHGTPGKGNFLPLVPAPVDPASAKMQANSDGSIYYKIAEGRVAMPSFKNLLSSADIWKLVAYFRSFNDAYVQKLAEKIVEEGLEGETVKILLAYLEDKGLIEAMVQAGSEESKPVAGAEVKLFAKRMFGNLAIEEVKRTSSEGIALFTAPVNLPADADGKIEFLAQLVNEDLYGIVNGEAILTVGIPNTNGSLREKRAMWNTGDMAPLWLEFTYFGAVLTVWGFIFYIMLQLRAIFMLGRKEEK